MPGEKCVLVADDSPMILAMVRDVLGRAGYAVMAAEDGLAALNTALREPVDLVISDVEMPELTGLQLCRILRNDTRTSSIPILILSTHSEQHEQFWGRETGADDYLPKPFRAEDLVARVRRLLERPVDPRRPQSAPGMPAITQLVALQRDNALLERQLLQLTVVHGIGAVAATTSVPREAIQAVIQQVARIVDFEIAGVACSQTGASFLMVRRAVHPQALARFHARLFEGLAVPKGELPTPTVLGGGEHVSASAPDDVAVEMLPLHAAEHQVGVFGVARRADRPFTDADRWLLKLIAGEAALVVESARLAEAERQHLAMLQHHSVRLEATVEERTQALHQALADLVDAHLDTMHRLAVAAEFRDEDSGAHIRRIGDYCAMLAERLTLGPEVIHAIRHASSMHDVGKIGIPDHILQKPGRLTAEEFQVMTGHTTIGARILGGSPYGLLQVAEEIAMTHHERWDGSGYPSKLAGDRIPITGRVCAVADVFDALTTRRTYKPALPNSEAYSILRDGRGTHFDPAVVDCFLGNIDAVEAIQVAQQKNRPND